MTYIIDTHVLLWWLFADKRLSRRAEGLLRDPQNQIVVSSATAWEIAIKHRSGRLDSAKHLVASYGAWLVRAGFAELRISSAHAIRAGAWDVEHRDPFDRMLAAQSTLEQLKLVTRDPVFEAFGTETIW
jgi:PIN domain nuclease of toxin-antitoxin system